MSEVAQEPDFSPRTNPEPFKRLPWEPPCPLALRVRNVLHAPANVPLRSGVQAVESRRRRGGRRGDRGGRDKRDRRVVVLARAPVGRPGGRPRVRLLRGCRRRLGAGPPGARRRRRRRRRLRTGAGHSPGAQRPPVRGVTLSRTRVVADG